MVYTPLVQNFFSFYANGKLILCIFYIECNHHILSNQISFHILKGLLNNYRSNIIYDILPFLINQFLLILVSFLCLMVKLFLLNRRSLYLQLSFFFIIIIVIINLFSLILNHHFFLKLFLYILLIL